MCLCLSLLVLNYDSCGVVVYELLVVFDFVFLLLGLLLWFGLFVFCFGFLFV